MKQAIATAKRSFDYYLTLQIDIDSRGSLPHPAHLLFIKVEVAQNKEYSLNFALQQNAYTI